MRGEILEVVIIVDLQIQLLVFLKLHLIHRIVQLPRGSRQFQSGVGFTVGRIKLCKIDAEYFFSQRSSLLAAVRAADMQMGLHRGRSSQTWNLLSWPSPVQV